MNRGLPPYASEFRDRHGRMRVRFRMKGKKQLYPKSAPGTDAFMAEYLAWKHGEPPPVGAERFERGTFDDLISQFYRSTTWRNIPKETTRNTYRGELERFRAKYGKRHVATISALNITKLMEKMADTPSAARNLLKRLRMLFNYAIVLGMRTDNPAKAVTAPKSNTKGFHEWTEAEIRQYIKRHPLGTKAYLALACLLYTAQRRSDVVNLKEDEEKPGYVWVKQLKTSAELSIRIHPRLNEARKACPSPGPTFLARQDGKPYTKESFGNWFRERCNEAGLPHCSAHGLRKAASRRMAELGLTNQQIKSITGHSTDSEVARYTKNADQARLADDAMSRIEAGDLANPPDPVSPANAEVLENADD